MRKILVVALMIVGVAAGNLPDNYYNDRNHKLLEPEFIADFLSEFNYSEMYTEDQFDCSEIAAHCEWLLENNGVETVFMVNSEHSHMFIACNTTAGWVALETCFADGKVVPVYDPDNWRYDSVVLPDISDIYTATESYTAVDWWETDFLSAFRSMRCYT